MKGKNKMRYLAFIHNEAGGDNDPAFGISFPDFPGCVSDGDSLDDALARGSDALAFHIKGMQEDGDAIPQPRDIQAVNADETLAGWRDNAVLVWVPVIIEAGAPQRVNISIDRALLEAIDIAANKRGMTRSGLLADAARKEIVVGG